MQEFQPLNDAEPIFGKFFIEASAGTGKTFAIEHAVRRLVLAGVPLSEILITTFTRAGARDLARRIYATLNRIDEASIYTIHSFCHRMLTEYAFEAKIDAHLESFDESGGKSQIETAVLDALRTLDNPGDFLALVNSYGRDMGRLTRKLISYLSNKPIFKEDTPFHRIAKKAEEKLRARKVGNQDSLLDTMLTCLSLPTFKHLVQKRFRAVIVDEFQDTNPEQWEIFYELFKESAETFLVVGDPKQSIYGFRGADLKTFFRAQKHFPEIYALSTNYRSLPGLVDALGRLFGGVEGLFTFQRDGQLQYHPVHAGKKESGGEIVVAVCEGVKGRSTSWPGEAIEEEKLFPYIANEIVSLGQKEIAILVKDRYQASRLSDFLLSRGILHISTATSSLVETKSFRFLELAFELAHHPRNLNLLRQFLMHPFVDETVTSNLEDPELQKHISELSRLGRVFKENGKAAFLRELIDRYFHASNEDYSDLMQLTQLLIEGGQIEELKTLDPDEYPMLKRRPLGRKANVTLLTSHVSKGLEFDVVFALGIASRTTGEEASPLESDQEKMRLLYVSFTRAREKLYLLFPQNRDGKVPPLGTASPLELLFARLGKPFLTHEETYKAIPSITLSIPHILIQDKPVLAPLKIEESLAKEDKITLTLPPPKQYLSFSQLVPTHTPYIFTDPDPLPGGPYTGNLFHLLFEKIIEIGLYYPWNDDMQKFVQQELKGTHLESSSSEVWTLIKTAFHTPFHGFSLKDVPPSNMLQEAEFFYSIEERKYMLGFADLIFLVDNTYYILDWKLNRLPSYEKADLEQAMQNNFYYTQAAIYSNALKRYLKHIPDATFGGTFYFFLRAKEKGVLHFVP